MDKIESKLKSVIIEFAPSFSEEQINLETKLVEDLMIDSLSMMQLIVKIEDEFKIEINDYDLYIEKLDKFECLLNLIKNAKHK